MRSSGTPRQNSSEVEAQVVTLQTRIIGQDFARRQAIRGAPQRAGLVCEHHWRQADAIFPQLAAQFRPVLIGRDEMAPFGNEAVDFFGHTPAQLRVAAAEGHHHRFGVLAEQPEDPLFEALLHSAGLAPR
jgi:hypothetical protein